MQTDKYGLFSSTFPLVLQLVRALGPPGWQLLEVSASGHLGDPLGVAGGGPRATFGLLSPLPWRSPSRPFFVRLRG